VTNLVFQEASKVVFDHLGYEFSKEELLIRALTHTSFVNENPGEKYDNQRLEFLGDAIIGLTIAETLMERLPDATEGQLTPRRSALVREKTLAELARRIDLGNLLRLGHGEDMNNGRDRSSILADAVEALIGAIHLEGGYEASRAATLKWFGGMLDEIVDGARPDDVKSSLQEALQAYSKEVPTYRVVREEGPDHAKVFEVEISVDGEVLACGRGKSKKAAEKDAAKRALGAMEER
jgi:ribonuclease-3